MENNFYKIEAYIQLTNDRKIQEVIENMHEIPETIVRLKETGTYNPFDDEALTNQILSTFDEFKDLFDKRIFQTKTKKCSYKSQKLGQYVCELLKIDCNHLNCPLIKSGLLNGTI